MPNRCKLASTASSCSRCSRTVTPVVPGCTRWHLAAKGTGRGAPDASVNVLRIGGGNSLPELWLRVRLGKGTLFMESLGLFATSWIASSATSNSSSRTRTFVLHVNSNGPEIRSYSEERVGKEAIFTLILKVKMSKWKWGIMKDILRVSRTARCSKLALRRR